MSIDSSLTQKSIMSFENNDPSLQRYLTEISQYALISAEREEELAILIKKVDKKAAAELIRANLRLVVKIAKEYSNLGLPLLDLISEGNIGLMKAVKRFDPSKGAKMSTYSSWWIKQSIKRALANQGKLVRLPVHLVEKLSKIRRVSEAMSEALGREATDEEVAEEVGLSAAKVSQLRMAALRPSSLDASVGEDSTTELGEIIRDEMAFNPFEQLREKDKQEEINDILNQLDERERRVIDYRFGMDGSEPISLEEVGVRMGVTRERIRQLQNIALEKMRRAFQNRESLSFSGG